MCIDKDLEEIESRVHRDCLQDRIGHCYLSLRLSVWQNCHLNRYSFLNFTKYDHWKKAENRVKYNDENLKVTQHSDHHSQLLVSCPCPLQSDQQPCFIPQTFSLPPLHRFLMVCPSLYFHRMTLLPFGSGPW